MSDFAPRSPPTTWCSRGNAKLLKKLPSGIRLGANETPLPAGYRLWKTNASSDNSDQRGEVKRSVFSFSLLLRAEVERFLRTGGIALG